MHMHPVVFSYASRVQTATVGRYSVPLLLRCFSNSGHTDSGPHVPTASSSKQANSGGRYTVYVSSLGRNQERSVTKELLIEHMCSAGEIVDAEIKLRPNGTPSGWAAVTYATKHAAKSAISTLNRSTLLDRSITVGVKKREDVKVESPKVLVKRMSPRTTQTELEQHMAQAGNIVRVKLLLLPSGIPSGSAIVEYSSVDEARAAFELLHDSELMDQCISVFANATMDLGGRENANQPNDKLTSPRVVVSNLSPLLDSDKLRKELSNFGRVSKVSLATAADGSCKGTAIVEFSDMQTARAALSKLNGALVMNRSLHIRPAQARDKVHDIYKLAKTNRVFVGNMSYNTTLFVLCQHFRDMGEVLDASIDMTVLNDGRKVSTGRGYVVFATQQEAERAESLKQGTQLHGRPLKLSRRDKGAGGVFWAPVDESRLAELGLPFII
jgi:RNA recognition motif-containing protein